jgi:hypothetical protein
MLTHEQHPLPQATAHGVVDPIPHCQRDDAHALEQLLMEWWIPYPAAYEMTPMPVSNCLWGGGFPTPLPTR